MLDSSDLSNAMGLQKQTTQYKGTADEFVGADGMDGPDETSSGLFTDDDLAPEDGGGHKTKSYARQMDANAYKDFKNFLKKNQEKVDEGN